MKKIYKILIFLFLSLVFFETMLVLVDVYNQNRAWKMIKILWNIKPELYKFSSLNDFNKQYHENIVPLLGCFYLVDTHLFDWYYPENRKWYVLWVKYHSFTFKFFYTNNYFVYPKYDLPYQNFCDGTCRDLNKEYFLKVINNFCE